MKRYIRSATDYDYEINKCSVTHRDGTVAMFVGNWTIYVHPDRTVEYFKVIESNNAVPPKALKEALRRKFGDDLMFLDDIEKASETPIESIEDAQQAILNSNIQYGYASRYMSDYSARCAEFRQKLASQAWNGTVDIAEMTTSKAKPTKRDFQKIAGISEERLLKALNTLYPDKTITITWKHYNQNKYSRVSATPAYTQWKLSIQ